MMLYAIIRLKNHLIRSFRLWNSKNPRHLPRPIISISKRIRRMIIMKCLQFLICIQSLKINQPIFTFIILILPKSSKALITRNNIQRTLNSRAKLQIKLLIPTKLLHLRRVKSSIHKHNLPLLLLTIIMHLTLINIIFRLSNLHSF